MLLDKKSFQVLVVLFSCVILLTSQFSLGSQAIPLSGNQGAFVDKIVFRVIEDPDQRILALENDDIDIIGNSLDHSYLPALEGLEDVTVTENLRNGYGYISFNTVRYPFNITAFRRAVAFAVDKESISNNLWNGLSQPLDSVVPKGNPWSIEGHLPYNYYKANTSYSNYLLDLAGFEYEEGGDFRLAPNGEPFAVTIECSGSYIAGMFAEYVANAMLEVGINARTVSDDFGDFFYRVIREKNYDMAAYGASFFDFDVDWLAYSFWGEYADVDYYNLPRFSNDSYDSWREQLLHSLEYDEVLEAAHEMQKILIYESPVLVCYQNFELFAHRNDRFTGHVNSVAHGVPNWWTNYKVHLRDSAGGFFGGTFRWSNAMDLDTFNFMSSSSQYTKNVVSMLYDSLFRMGPDCSMIPWLAESYAVETHLDNPDIPEGHSRYTFDLIQNATWTDNTPLTAEDVAYSLNYYRDASVPSYGRDLVNMTGAFAPSPHKLTVEFSTESFWHLSHIAYTFIIPKHVFVEIGMEGWARWNPMPPDDEMVTSGPFIVTEYVPGEFITLTRNPNYFYVVSRVPQIDNPSDITYSFGTSGHRIVWSPSHPRPDRYEVYRNGSLVESDSWNGSQISVNVDGLPVGVYNYTLLVYDTSNNRHSDTVFVTVLPDTNMVTTTTTDQIDPWGPIPRLVSQVVTITSVAVIIIFSTLIIRNRLQHH